MGTVNVVAQTKEESTYNSARLEDFHDFAVHTFPRGGVYSCLDGINWGKINE